MLESLRDTEYLSYREAALAIFGRLDGIAALEAFGLDEILLIGSGRVDLAPVCAFLEAQGYRGGATSALARVGLTGLTGQFREVSAGSPILLGSLIGRTTSVAVPGFMPGSSVAVDVVGSGLTLLSTSGPQPPLGDAADDYFRVVSLDGVPRRLLVGEEDMNGMRATILARTRLAVAAEMLGICDRLLDDAVAFVRQRRQFGRPIASFQAVQQLLSWAATERHQLSCLCDIAINEARRGEVRAELGKVVKAIAGRVLHAVVQQTTQATGAISFTWEYSLNRLHRRALALDQYAGASADLIAAMGRQLRVDGSMPDLMDLETLVT